MKLKITKQSAIKMTQIATMMVVFFLFILSDYIRVGGTISFITDWKYWTLVITNLVLIVGIMVTLREYHKNNLIVNSVVITKNIDFIERANRAILNYAYTTKLNKWLDEEVNPENKYQAYIRKINKKLNFVSSLFFIPEKKRDEWIKKLEKKLETPKEEVLKQFVRYKKVTRTSLMAGVDGKVMTDDPYDTSSHNLKDTAMMIGTKSLLVFLFASFTGTMIIQLMWQGWAGLWGTMLKIFSLLLACNCAIQQANDFVKYNLTQAIENRVVIISEFVNQEEILKNRVIELKKIDNESTVVLDSNLIKNDDINNKTEHT